MTKTVVLLILDGWGIARDYEGNAITRANLPNFQRLMKQFPHGKLSASGEAVGLPRNEVGNTETGHLNLGAGFIVYQDLPRINMAIADGSFFKNETLLAAIDHARKNNSALHLMGLIGSGGVHANNEHLFALLMLCAEERLTNVVIHLFTDGRDSPPTVALDYVTRVEKELERHQFGTIGSITGRYFAMDRDFRWERTLAAYHVLTDGVGPIFSSAEELINQSYKAGSTDEFIKPSLIKDKKGALHTIHDHDSVVFYNFRIDRPRQLTKSFVFDDFESEILGEARQGGVLPFFNLFAGRKRTLERGKKLEDLYFVTMTEYERGLPVHVAFPKITVSNPIGKVIADHGLRQLRVAESEKERFVTYYFNGQREMPFIGEERRIIQSLKVATYDKAPHMRTAEIGDAIIAALNEQAYNAIIANIAGPDMVGHTGVLSAAVRAVEIVDEMLGKLVEAIIQHSAILLITADHGNVEEMINFHTGEMNTEHSENLVPLIAVASELQGKPFELRDGILSDVAPTILAKLGLEKPREMTGRNILEDISR
ncbi:MAG TPA: 2,3-bisphosphoglycerate-independent phosphoglycerate mutase [Patescibacteria group bacterium]|nr:2,3-bisphosphoglycerate-independent phosphoglycerate mutase [Patescibacteria group bacterium]